MINKTIEAADKEWLSRCEDFEQSVLRYKNVRFSRFVSPHDLAVFKAHFRPSPFVSVMEFGGNAECERVMLGFFPDFLEPDENIFPITRILISGVSGMSHRDILGSVLGLGIKREMTGDIFINDDKAVLMCDESISEFLLYNLKTVGRKKVSVSVFEDDEDISFAREFELERKVVSSTRLDAVISAACGLSRSEAVNAVSSGYVNVNFSLAEDASKKLSEGDTISVRRHGRFVLDKICGVTKKGRISIEIKKFV